MVAGGLTGEPLYLEMLRRLQLTVPYQQRDFVAQQLARAIEGRLRAAGIEPFEQANPAFAAGLLDAGYAQLGRMLVDEQVDEILAFLADRPVVGEYVGSGTDARLLDKTAAQATDLPHVSYPLKDVLLAPHLLELANSRFMLGLAQSYLGCVPTLYLVNLMIARPSNEPTFNVQTFHRDYDDFRFVTLFVFLSDIARDVDGAHVFIRGSQSAVQMAQRAARLTDFTNPSVLSSTYHVVTADRFFDHLAADMFATRYLADHEVRMIGPRGTAFLADTYGLHKGIAPAAGQRIVFWARYGLYPNLSHATVDMAPLPWSLVAHRLPDDARSRYVNRLLFV
jgi:hypothetical protein